MGEMGEYWRDYRAHKRANKRPAVPPSFGRAEIKAGWRRCSDWHWQRRLDGDLLDYWPTSHKWRWRDKTHHGCRTVLNAFIERNGG